MPAPGLQGTSEQGLDAVPRTPLDVVTRDTLGGRAAAPCAARRGCDGHVAWAGRDPPSTDRHCCGGHLGRAGRQRWNVMEDGPRFRTVQGSREASSAPLTLVPGCRPREGQLPLRPRLVSDASFEGRHRRTVTNVPPRLSAAGRSPALERRNRPRGVFPCGVRRPAGFDRRWMSLVF